MEGAQKRRKVEKKDEEEEKMEMFYALIRSIKDARDRQMKIAEDRPKQLKDDEQEKKQAIIDHSANKLPSKPHNDHHKHKAAAVWMPTFELEDFMVGTTANNDNRFIMNIKARSMNNHVEPSHQTSSSGKCQEEAKEEGHGLDLKLSL